MHAELMSHFIQMQCGHNQDSAAGKEAVWQTFLTAKVRFGTVSDQQGIVVTCIPENVPQTNQAAVHRRLAVLWNVLVIRYSWCCL